MLVQGGEGLWPSPPTFRHQTILSAHDLAHELIHELNNKAAENFKEIFRRLLHSQFPKQINFFIYTISNSLSNHH